MSQLPPQSPDQPEVQDVGAEIRPDEQLEILGYTDIAGQTVDEGRGRVFPCERCGADLTFHIGQQRLKCPYCGYEKDLAQRDDAAIVEHDFRDMLERLEVVQEQGRHDEIGTSEVTCRSCAANVLFTGTLTSTECPYCGSPIQREHVHSATHRIPVDGVLPFLVDREVASAKLAAWVSSRWFAPNDFLKRGVDGQFNGVYLPYWTYDTLTHNVYRGERGEDYWETVGTGDNRRRERRTRWYPAEGTFERFFDDVLVTATQGLPTEYMVALEPWPLTKCIPFTQQVLAGFFARTYDVRLDDGFRDARRRIDAAIHQETLRRIGGDRQQIHALKSDYAAVTFKHLLLPVWLLAYRYSGQPYRVFINAATGEVQGERPYSWVKITLAALTAALAGLTLAILAQQ